MDAGQILKTGVRAIVDFALPPRCPACGIIVEADHRFCLSCWSGLHFLGDPCCTRCGIPFETPQGEGAECGSCLSAPSAFDRARAAMAYGTSARRVALKLKYGRRIGLARLIALNLVRHVPDQAREDMLLVPVPLHRWRIWGRGFNQSALIADALSKLTGVQTHSELLLRAKATPPLRGKGAAARRQAVRGAFILAPNAKAALAGRTVLLIDDVHTSGATAEACARMLKHGGVNAVHLLCWARVLPDAHDSD